MCIRDRPSHSHAHFRPAHADALLRERSLLYVAATRARDELAVTYKGSLSVLIESQEGETTP